MMKRILEKSEHYRQRVAYVATLIIGLFIFSAWLIIANFNIREAFNPYSQDQTKMAQEFEKNLPSLRQSESVTTELVKNHSAGSEGESTDETEMTEEEKPFWKFW
ncbi:MAG: hypothetical protein U9O20_01465 [Patescibacteria group bacterium]|nr:hypothetical protein [Patescibacteria group bacterium]